MKKQVRIFAKDLDKETENQFDNCVKEKYVVKAALMPDAHQGYVAPIGSVLVTRDYIVPSWVGYDIGCGVTAVKIKGKDKLKLIKQHKKKIFEKVKKYLPMGLGALSDKKNISQETLKEYEKLVDKFKKGPYNKDVLQFLEKGKAVLHLGSLGHGNHFVEICFSEKNEAWIVVHSGSRGVGHKIAEIYMKKSSNKKIGFEETWPLHKDEILGKEYLNALDFALDFALLNRMEIIRRVVLGLEEVLDKKVKWEVWANKNHNHAILEKGLFVHRKGATPSKKGERGIIPANMKDGSFLVKGLGNKEFLESSSHGAGRKYSRQESRKKFGLGDFQKVMLGIESEVKDKFIDEIPMAYKNIDEVMDSQKKSVKIVSHLKPIINWKG